MKIGEVRENRLQIKILNIDFKDEFKRNSLLQYMSIPSSEIKLLQDKEIKEAFHDMLKKAEHEILIISPWVGWRPYREIVAILKQKKSVSIKVLYGIDDTSGSEKRQNDSDIQIQKYSADIGSNFKSKKTNTHVKLVICDNSCYLIGSMNVLSFSADYEEFPHLHQEVSFLARDREMIKKLKKAYFNW